MILVAVDERSIIREAHALEQIGPCRCFCFRYCELKHWVPSKAYTLRGCLCNKAAGYQKLAQDLPEIFIGDPLNYCGTNLVHTVSQVNLSTKRTAGERSICIEQTNQS